MCLNFPFLLAAAEKRIGGNLVAPDVKEEVQKVLSGILAQALGPKVRVQTSSWYRCRGDQ